MLAYAKTKVEAILRADAAESRGFSCWLQLIHGRLNIKNNCNKTKWYKEKAETQATALATIKAPGSVLATPRQAKH